LGQKYLKGIKKVKRGEGVTLSIHEWEKWFNIEKKRKLIIPQLIPCLQQGRVGNESWTPKKKGIYIESSKHGEVKGLVEKSRKEGHIRAERFKTKPRRAAHKGNKDLTNKASNFSQPTEKLGWNKTDYEQKLQHKGKKMKKKKGRKVPSAQ